MKVLFLTQTPEIGASARYRVYQFVDYLKSQGILCVVSPANSMKVARNLTLRASFLDRMIGYGQPVVRRFFDLFRVRDYDVIFLQRDIFIHLPAVFEWLISRLNRNLIFDFDDALYTFPSGGKFSFLYRLRGRNKIQKIIKMAKFVIVGNNHLKTYSQRFNANIEVVPTSINTDKYSVKEDYKIKGVPVIGWVGRPGSSLYLQKFKDIFIELSKKHNFILKTVGAGRLDIEGVKIVNEDWKAENEVSQILSFDIGIMPLSDSEWTKGKSATKILQCMAAGVPVVCSAIGANCDIVKDGENGFLAVTKDDWIRDLSLLIENEDLRIKFGEAGRATVEDGYSVKVNALKLKKVLEKVCHE